MKTYLIIVYVILFLSCTKQENPSKDIIEDKVDMIDGKIVGYLKCAENETKNPLFGICIVTNNKDSILSFNVPSSILDLPENEIPYGAIDLFNGDSVQFNYRNANEEEIKQFYCPPSITLGPSRYPLLDFRQVVITEINKMQ